MKRENRTSHRGDYSYFYQPPPADIETTSYVLLSLMKNNEIEKVRRLYKSLGRYRFKFSIIFYFYRFPKLKLQALPLVRWLIQQRNSFGGFSSTQDTVLGLQVYLLASEDSCGNVNCRLSVPTRRRRTAKMGTFKSTSRVEPTIISSKSIRATQ